MLKTTLKNQNLWCYTNENLKLTLSPCLKSSNESKVTSDTRSAKILIGKRRVIKDRQSKKGTLNTLLRIQKNILNCTF